MSPLSSWLDELLACEDDDLPDELIDRIVARGDAARGRLLDVATGAEYRGLGSPGRGLAAVHALDVLTEMPPHDATAARLVESLAADPESEITDDLVDSLLAMGDVAVPYAVKALAEATNPYADALLAEILVAGDVRSEEAFGALCAAFERSPGAVAHALGTYGDDRALPLLVRAFDRHVVGRGPTYWDEEACIATADAIEELGGSLNDLQKAKLARARAREQKLARREIVRLRAEKRKNEAELAALEAPGPNDPCPCGSGRKFKKCHEGDEEFDGGTADDDDEAEFDDA